MPSRTANTYVRAEVGASSQIYRDAKMKLGLLQHIMKNTVELRINVEREWSKGNKWVETCKKYMDVMNINMERLERISKDNLKKIINKKENEAWKREMEGKRGLNIIEKQKNTLDKKGCGEMIT